MLATTHDDACRLGWLPDMHASQPNCPCSTSAHHNSALACAQRFSGHALTAQSTPPTLQVTNPQSTTPVTTPMQGQAMKHAQHSTPHDNHQAGLGPCQIRAGGGGCPWQTQTAHSHIATTMQRYNHAQAWQRPQAIHHLWLSEAQSGCRHITQRRSPAKCCILAHRRSTLQVPCKHKAPTTTTTTTK